MTQTYKIGSGTYELPARPLVNPTISELAYLAAFDAAATFANAKPGIINDPHLSTSGKNAKLAPMADGLWRQIFISTTNIHNESLHLDKREAELFAVPKISTPFEIAVDREIRDWFRTLKHSEKLEVLQRISSGLEQVQTVGALLRSPIPMALDQEMTLVQEAHRANRRAEFPEEWQAIKEGRDAIAWAQRGMGHVTGISGGLTERNETEVMQLALTTGHERAAEIMFSEAAVKDMRRRLRPAA